jgi:hypothetical protein
MNNLIAPAGRKATALLTVIAGLAGIFAFSNFFYSSAQKQMGRTALLTGTISGRVFQDFNGNGAFDSSGGTAAAPTAIDIGIAGVTVSVYDAAGALRGTAASATATGLFSITATGTGPYRVEFTTSPAGYTVSARSTDSVSGGSAADQASN